MKIIYTCLSLIAFTISSVFAQTSNSVFPVNAIIGDSSYVNKYGKLPDDASSQFNRINTHLEYVESVLKNGSDKNLNQTQKQNRRIAMEHLKNYRLRGEFPKVPENQSPSPCFIDNSGTICALGYVVQQTAGQEVAEAINAKYKYEYVMNMEDPILESWMEKYGLSKVECAMIQPTYRHEREPILIKPEPPSTWIVREPRISDLELAQKDSILRLNKELGLKDSMLVEKDSIVMNLQAKNDSLETVIAALAKNEEQLEAAISKQIKFRNRVAILGTAMITVAAAWGFQQRKKWVQIRQSE